MEKKSEKLNCEKCANLPDFFFFFLTLCLSAFFFFFLFKETKKNAVVGKAKVCKYKEIWEIILGF